MPGLLGPTSRTASSRLWSTYVNVLAASPLVTSRTRTRMLRSAGLDVATEKIGPGCWFHTYAISIGWDTRINNGCWFENHAPVTIGREVAFGYKVLVLTSTHDPGPPERRHGEWRTAPVTIGDGCWIGARSTILPGVKIGSGVVIAAGAVVSEDCEPHGLYAGVPARRVRDLTA
jgi:maltose O-acetyltransferase